MKLKFNLGVLATLFDWPLLLTTVFSVLLLFIGAQVFASSVLPSNISVPSCASGSSDIVR